MKRVKMGDTITIHYTARTEDGTVFDSSAGRTPLEITIGGGDLFPALERALVGMAVGEKKEIRISAKDGFGPHFRELIQEVERIHIPENLTIKIGDRLKIAGSNNRSMIVTVADANSKTVTLDGNHPLADRDLVFDIELVAIG